MKYTYKDNAAGKYEGAQWVAPVVFECEAEDILKADEMYKSALGKDVVKQPHIGCVVSNNHLTSVRK